MVNRFVLLGLLSFAGVAAAQDIVLGRSTPLSGPLGAAGQSVQDGMGAYLARVQREGGVNGRRVVLKVLDDGYDVDRHAANVRQLLDRDKVDALVLSAGTSHIDAAYPAVRASGKPLIGTMSGATVLRSSDKPLVYHLRASYADEVHRLVAQAVTVRQARAFAVWQDDGLGRDAMAALDTTLRGAGIPLAGQRKVRASAMDTADLAREIRASGADALFLLCVTPCAAATLVATRSGGGHELTPYALSIVSGETLAKAAGPAARGTVISQVMPNPFRASSPLVQDYQRDVRAFTGREAFSYFSLEGYVAAKVAVEAARVATAGPARRSMDDAMQQLVRRGGDGIPVSRADAPGARPHPVTLSMIDANGRLIH